MIQSKPSEKGEIITYLSRMGDVLHNVAEGRKLIFTLGAVHAVIDGNKPDAMLGEKMVCVNPYLQIVAASRDISLTITAPMYPSSMASIISVKPGRLKFVPV